MIVQLLTGFEFSERSEQIKLARKLRVADMRECVDIRQAVAPGKWFDWGGGGGVRDLRITSEQTIYAFTAHRSEKQERHALWSVTDSYRCTRDYRMATTPARKFKCCDYQHR